MIHLLVKELLFHPIKIVNVSPLSKVCGNIDLTSCESDDNCFLIYLLLCFALALALRLDCS